MMKSPEVTKKDKQKSVDSSSPILTQQELSTWNPPTFHRFQSPTEKGLEIPYTNVFLRKMQGTSIEKNKTQTIWKK